MSTLPAQVAISGAIDLEWVNAVWAEITADLTRTKNEIYAEIHNYPPPIPACDAQFNFLLEERAKIFQELGRVGTLAKTAPTASDPLRLIEEFLQSSAYLQAEVKQKIRSVLPTTAVGGVPA